MFIKAAAASVHAHQQWEGKPAAGGKAKGKRQKPKGKSGGSSARREISSAMRQGNSFLPFAFVRSTRVQAVTSVWFFGLQAHH